MTIRRMKTYTGEQGYVYQYYFVGERPASGESGMEYIFDVTSDRKSTYSVSVVLPAKLVEDWEVRHGRKLADAERYAAVKMRLFQGFDEIENMMEDGRKLVLDGSSLDATLGRLGVA